jgi:hypothetical protein
MVFLLLPKPIVAEQRTLTQITAVQVVTDLS